jgi:hypothetical protein
MAEKEYIKCEDAKKTMCRMCEGGSKLVCGTLNDLCTTMRLFDAIPAADVVPVVRGKWTRIDYEPHGHDYKCSACGWKNDMPTHFCPNCGADMRNSAEEGE